MNDPNIHNNMIKVHVKYINFINHQVTHASETSLALGISKIALGHLSFLNWYGIYKKGPGTK